MDISAEAAHLSYDLGKQVYSGTLSISAAVRDLLSRVEINRNSAEGTLRNVVHLLKGERFARRNSLQTTRIILDSIFNDFGAQEQANAVSALRKHIAYYRTVSRTTQQTLQELTHGYHQRIVFGDPSAPPEIRILPMDRRTVFSEYTSLEELQSQFFLRDLPSRQNGHYFYKENAPNAPAGAVVLFQSDNCVVASATLVGFGDEPRREGFRGVMYFDRNSIKVFEPVDADGMRLAWPNFRRFTNAMQKRLDPAQLPAFESQLRSIRYPNVPLPSAEGDEEFDDESLGPRRMTARAVVEAQIKRRRGQGRFRREMLEAYSNTCCVSGCEVIDVLEAAHIRTESGLDDHSVQNGLLLRADIHTLFDLDLLGIDDSLRVHIHPRAAAAYSQFAGACIRVSSTHPPCRDALRERFQAFEKNLAARPQ